MVITQTEEESLFFQYLDFLPAPVLLTRENKSNKNSKTLFVNKAFIQSIGYEVDDIPDHVSFMKYAYPDANYRHEIEEVWINKSTQLANHKTSLVQFCSKVRCKDQQDRWFEIRTELKSTIGQGVVIILFNNMDKAKKQVREYVELSRKDPLTQLANRRYMNELLQKEKRRQSNQETEYDFSVVMADIDFFKTINDTYGHAYGDYVIEKVAKLINQHTRKIDVTSRWGGEEYLLLLPQTNITEARIVVKKIMKYIHEYHFEWEGVICHVSLTYGITGYRKGEDINDTINRADHCLYQGKERGRDCIVTDGLYEGWGT
ncbi:MAG: GGDEF domain-containing protein [Cocleimonas sp.]|nr:GGDEF domain-containing protein [Cocleimonas sp.]